jgi:hypothetical protein
VHPWLFLLPCLCVGADMILEPELIGIFRKQICTTCITSACSSLNVIDFPVVFIDEASMSTEPATLIPIMKGVSKPLSLKIVWAAL